MYVVYVSLIFDIEADRIFIPEIIYHSLFIVDENPVTIRFVHLNYCERELVIGTLYLKSEKKIYH